MCNGCFNCPGDRELYLIKAEPGVEECASCGNLPEDFYWGCQTEECPEHVTICVECLTPTELAMQQILRHEAGVEVEPVASQQEDPFDLLMPLNQQEQSKEMSSQDIINESHNDGWDDSEEELDI